MAASLIAVAWPTTPWWVVPILVVIGLAVACWRHYLSHQENMKALDKVKGDQVAEVMRSIRKRRTWWRRPPHRLPP